ncbi:hypothetical protein CEF21_07125 [Bacillus sp. FJAT-42376]|uniref:hypothetical protein n=1 Tax=Bacillus sp. FJAT-42376 TaxID=2014076 RepID=UPI000F516B18|nr:hypothetical protein [Bacillus sp. FJAT-42376]AZB42079.1 hypothetical protein CEF21_07125 [Bacillus sp. FJAT-42376]
MNFILLFVIILICASFYTLNQFFEYKNSKNHRGIPFKLGCSMLLTLTMLGYIIILIVGFTYPPSGIEGLEAQKYYMEVVFYGPFKAPILAAIAMYGVWLLFAIIRKK